MDVAPASSIKKATKEQPKCNQCCNAEHEQSDEQEKSYSSSDYGSNSLESSEEPKRGKKKVGESKRSSKRSQKGDVPESSSAKHRKCPKEVKIADPYIEIFAGDRVHTKCLVIYTQKQRAKNRINTPFHNNSFFINSSLLYHFQPPNVTCRVDAWSKLINDLDPTIVEAVKAMRFGGLLEIKLNFLPRQLCYWLMSRVVRDALVIVPNAEGVGEATLALVAVVVERYGTPQENIDEYGNVRSIVKISVDEAVLDVEGQR
uniref:Uncharacterized protein n=1 Tax=Chenopodium quinoa TaxID=63459 RepID=A0A803N4M9_CHEQI